MGGNGTSFWLIISLGAGALCNGLLSMFSCMAAGQSCSDDRRCKPGKREHSPPAAWFLHQTIEPFQSSRCIHRGARGTTPAIKSNVPPTPMARGTRQSLPGPGNPEILARRSVRHEERMRVPPPRYDGRYPPHPQVREKPAKVPAMTSPGFAATRRAATFSATLPPRPEERSVFPFAAATPAKRGHDIHTGNPFLERPTQNARSPQNAIPSEEQGRHARGRCGTLHSPGPS